LTPGQRWRNSTETGLACTPRSSASAQILQAAPRDCEDAREGSGLCTAALMLELQGVASEPLLNTVGVARVREDLSDVRWAAHFGRSWHPRWTRCALTPACARRQSMSVPPSTSETPRSSSRAHRPAPSIGDLSDVDGPSTVAQARTQNIFSHIDPVWSAYNISKRRKRHRFEVSVGPTARQRVYFRHVRSRGTTLVRAIR
jgi:hypothetical protein